MQSVRAEAAEVLHIDGEWVEGHRKLEFVATFDEAGNMTSEVAEAPDEWQLANERSEITHNAEGRVGERSYFRAGTLQRRVIYTYDEQGKVIKERHYDAGGALNHTTLHAYDVRGKKVAMKYLKADGTPDGEYHYINNYDAQGNTVKQVIIRRSKVGDKFLIKPLCVQRYTISYYCRSQNLI